MRFAVTLIAAFFFGVQLVHAADTEHTVEIEVTVSEGSVGAVFSRSDGSTEVKPIVDPNGVMLEMNVPTAKRKLKKIKGKTGDAAVVSGEPWKEKFTVTGNGVYILNLSEWGSKSSAKVKLVIDGEVRFEGSGEKDDFDKWAYKKFSGKTRKTGELELCVDLKK